MKLSLNNEILMDEHASFYKATVTKTSQTPSPPSNAMEI